MAGRRKRGQPAAPKPDDDVEAPLRTLAGQPAYWGITPNRVIAYNLAQARNWRRLTQDQAAAALEPYLGARWSKATFSAAERSYTTTKVRNFDADEIVAFAQAFDLPITFFFLPPPPTADHLPLHLETAPPPAPTQPIARLFDLIFGTPADQGLLTLRMSRFLQALPAHTGLLSDAQQRIASYTRERLTNLIRHALSDIASKETTLRSLANQLEDLRIRAGDLSTLDLTSKVESGEEATNKQPRKQSTSATFTPAETTDKPRPPNAQQAPSKRTARRTGNRK